MGRARSTRLIVALIVLLVASSPGASAWDGDDEAGGVPTPTVAGPITGGLRTGEAYGASQYVESRYGFVEEEYFISGTARNHGESAATTPAAPFTTRMLVWRPLDAERFNGSVIVEWTNVTAQRDFHGWPSARFFAIPDGYAFVALTAQKVGVDHLRNWDPVRYGALEHPGDDFSYDILSQAIKALKTGAPAPLGDLQPSHLYAEGASQSCGFLKRYVTNVHDTAEIVDGFLPYLCSDEGLKVPAGTKVLWVNSQSESGSAFRALTGGEGGYIPGDDTEDFIYWEVAGMVHAAWDGSTTNTAPLLRDEGSLAGLGVPANMLELPIQETYDNYGQDGGGPCPVQLFPSRYPIRAAMVALDAWVKDDDRPTSAPRYERDPATGNPLIDPDTGNVRGGLRLPPIVAPVATYTAECGLFGSTIPYDSAKLAELYPTHDDYVTTFRAAAEQAVANGWLRAPDAAELVHAAEASDIGGPPKP